MSFCKMKNRNEVAENIIKYIKNNENHVFLISGSKGSGRRYILNLIEKSLYADYKLFSIFDNEIYQINKKQRRLKFSSISLNFAYYAGIAVTFTKNDATKLNYIISNLKGFIAKKKPVCFIIPNINSLNSITGNFINTLIENIDYISAQINQPIFILLSSNKDYARQFHLDVQIELIDYDKTDLKEYLIKYHNYLNINKFDEKVNTLYELCGANFHLVNAFHKDVLLSDYMYDVDTILRTKMSDYLNNANFAQLTQHDMRQIIEISALSLRSFNKKIIAKVSEYSERDVELCLNYAKEEYFLEQILNDYDFISVEIKRALAQKAIHNYEARLIAFYNYITENYQDDYLQRLLYVTQIDEEYSESKYALAFLALQRAFILHDTEAINKVKNCFIDESVLCLYIKALELYNNGDYESSSCYINKLFANSHSAVLSAVLLRQKFKSLQLSNGNFEELNRIASQLFELVLHPINLNLEESFDSSDESVLRLSIIYDLAPYYLDDKNDRAAFNRLFNLGDMLYRKIKTSTGKCVYGEFITNIFYRKAFLYAIPEHSIAYYNEALHFFESNKIYDQATMTLSGRAGMEIAFGDYEHAIEDCISAENLIQQYNLIIPESEKIKNNLLVAKFLLFERKENEYQKIKDFARETIQQLEKLIPDNPSALKHVILTNIASLCLYCNDLSAYNNTKSLLEKSLECKDVSNIYDVNVNDFYRYHFAWFEFYAHALQYKWDKANQIIVALENFCATLLINEAKHKARILVAKKILETKKLPSPYQYCKYFTKDIPQIPRNMIIRGLLMSDLQFTSYD